MPETNTKTVLVTGASSGIGRATALAFAQRGLNVSGTARRADRLDTLAQEIAPLPGDFLPVAADVREKEAVEAAVTAVQQRFGRLDVLVANAGIGQRGALVDSAWEDIDTVIRTNIDGVLHSIRAAVPAMRQVGGGHIVIVSSVTYRMITPYTATYAATKAFVSSIADSLRMELEPEQIRITDMLVGRTQTEFNENRLGEGQRRQSRLPVMPPEQVAEAIVSAVLDRPRERMTLRWFDRLLLLGNLLAPKLVGRQALKQYR
jgi:NADP-dependent 3-hydroxy acid dehydrogenase YdfG